MLPSDLDRPDPLPVFVLGPARGGTTLLVRLLDGHPLLAVLPTESQFYPVLTQRTLSRRVMQIADFLDWHSLPHVLGTRPFTLLTFQHRRGVAVWLKRWAEELVPGEPGVPAVVEQSLRPLRGAETYWRAFLDVYQRLTHIELAGKRYWVEKTPWNERFVPLIERFFGPDCRYLHIIRDPRAVIASTFPPGLETAARARLTVRRCFLWSRSVHRCRHHLGRLPGRYFALRYEDLVTRTKEIMRRVCQFLDIPAEESVFTATRLGLPVSPNSAFPVTAPPGVVFSSQVHGYRGALSPAELDCIEQLLGPQMMACGYSPRTFRVSSGRHALNAIPASARSHFKTALEALKVARTQRQYAGVHLSF